MWLSLEVLPAGWCAKRNHALSPRRCVLYQAVARAAPSAAHLRVESPRDGVRPKPVKMADEALAPIADLPSGAPSPTRESARARRRRCRRRLWRRHLHGGQDHPRPAPPSAARHDVVRRQRARQQMRRQRKLWRRIRPGACSTMTAPGSVPSGSVSPPAAPASASQLLLCRWLKRSLVCRTCRQVHNSLHRAAVHGPKAYSKR